MRTEDQITWQCWQEIGSPCLTLDGKPITPNMNACPGLEILVPALLGGYAKATIENEDYACSEHMLYFLMHDPTHGLLCTGSANLAAIKKLEFKDG